jgi:hypothetical protein
MNRYKRLLALILCLTVLFVQLLFLTYVEEHINHDCTGKDCSICVQIEASIKSINNYKSYYTAAIFVLTIVIVAVIICPVGDVLCLFGRTLISLKVELLD